jgi:acid phosphatase
MAKRLAVLFAAALGLLALAAGSAAAAGNGDANKLRTIDHIVVIYEENHSFDNLYGGWERVRGLGDADAAHTVQLGQTGPSSFAPFECLYMDDLNLQACPPTPLVAFSSPNGWLKGTGSPGGCTRDIVHRLYHEIFQLNGGQQNRYVLASDAAGLVMGVYDSTALPVYHYLHQPGHPKYAILDNFFQGAFGGSFLNHQWLIAAAAPVCSAANGCPANAAHSILDRNGAPFASSPPASSRPPGMGALYVSPDSGLVNGALAQSCGLPTTFPGLACGDYAVNTMTPAFQPTSGFAPRLPAQTNPTIGDRLSAGDVDWAWYSGGWSNADGDVDAPGWTNGTGPAPTPTGCSDPFVDPTVAAWPRCPDNLFQYHHQPFNYYAAFSTETSAGLANRAAHLRDEQEFIDLANSSTSHCALKPVSFVKPIGEENEHPGYASEPGGSDHLVSLLQAIEGSKCKEHTMVVVTYDEFGGEWDHVPPPGQGNDNGPHDVWGPGTRVPTLVLGPHLQGPFVVDHTQYDTTSILRTIEQRYSLAPLGTRDAEVNSLANVFDAH